MDYEFDTDKDRENKRKHGFSLSLGREILQNLVMRSWIGIAHSRSGGSRTGSRVAT